MTSGAAVAHEWNNAFHSCALNRCCCCTVALPCVSVRASHRPSGIAQMRPMVSTPKDKSATDTSDTRGYSGDTAWRAATALWALAASPAATATNTPITPTPFITVLWFCSFSCCCCPLFVEADFGGANVGRKRGHSWSATAAAAVAHAAPTNRESLANSIPDILSQTAMETNACRDTGREGTVSCVSLFDDDEFHFPSSM